MGQYKLAKRNLRARRATFIRQNRPTNMSARATPFAILAALSVGAVAWAQDADAIVRRSVDRDWTNFNSQRNYVYQQRAEFREYNGGGKLDHKRSLALSWFRL